MLTDEDKTRLHNLLDYAIENDEEFVIMQYAEMNLNFHLHRTIYRMTINKTEE